MTDLIFVTGNTNKARLFSELVGMSIDHHAVDVDEIQSLDLVEVASHKAKAAYVQLKKPVIVEDAGVVIKSLGRLPGPFIKWFVQEIGLEGICRLADKDSQRAALASDVFVYYDGETLNHFKGNLNGIISEHPLGDGGWDWDKIFIPHDSHLTLGQMDEVEYRKHHLRIKPMMELKTFLSSLDRR